MLAQTKHKMYVHNWK